MIIFETEVIDIIERTKGVKSFRFLVKRDIQFTAGQFFFVGIIINGQERTKHFSFSNSPTEKGYIEFTKRMSTSEFSAGLNGLKKGDWAKIKMPYGSFTLNAAYKKIAFLSGGIGITPIRSMCKFATDTSMDIDIRLVYGNNTEADIIFKEDFDNMGLLNKNLKVVYTLTSPDVNRTGWRQETGFIDDKMIRKTIPDYEERKFCLCGPPQMVTTLTDILKNKLKITTGNIVTENFTGYET